MGESGGSGNKVTFDLKGEIGASYLMSLAMGTSAHPPAPRKP